MSALSYLSWVDAATQIREGKLSSKDYLESQLARIESLNPSLNAFLHVDAKGALERAAKADQVVSSGADVGPMHGVPFALKDIIDVAGMPCTAHSKILADRVAESNATVTERLEAAGGICVGKLATHEFAFGGPCFDLPWPPARNPWDKRMFPGGSSSGSGSAIAAGLVPVALGTDTGGSVRNPASMCGIVGLKATYGLVSRRGVIPLAFSLDHVGPMTRTVRENAALLQVVAGHDSGDPASANQPIPNYLEAVDEGTSKDLRGLRIGVIRHFFEEDMQASDPVRAGIDAALAVFESLGASIEVVRTRPMQEFSDGNRFLLLAEAYAVHQQWMRERPQDYAQMTREKLAPGAFLSAADYVQALRRRPKLTAEIDALFDSVDVIITASSMDLPFPIDDPELVARCYPRQARAPFNLTGHPALALPVGYHDDGVEPALPLSLQLVGAHFDEVTLYRVASAYEAATQWTERHPPLGVK